MQINQVKVIGIGGIGSHLVFPLCRYLDALSEKAYVTLIDGDQFEPKNSDRQEFFDFGNKAEVTAERFKTSFPELPIEAKPWYVTEENLFLCIKTRDVVFLCVDNHATRKLVSDYCKTLSNVLIISGGNEHTDGNVQIYLRKSGKDVTPSLTHLHPEIASPKDRNPAEMSCEELANNSAPQLIFTNFMVAACMLAAFWMVNSRGKKEVRYSEQYFDLETGCARSTMRKVRI